MSVQTYITAFDDLTLHCELQKYPHQITSMLHFGLRTDIQWAMIIHSQTIRILAHANQLAQDIDASLKASLDRRFVSKAREEYRCPPETNTWHNTNTTKDPNDKSIICDLSVLCVWSCCCSMSNREPSHWGCCLDDDNLDQDVYEPEGALVTQMRKLGYLIWEWVSLVVRCLHTTSRDEDWRRFSVFYTYVVHEKEL